MTKHDSTSSRSSQARRRGYVAIAFTFALLLILGVVGLAFDIGRMYVTKSESQAFVDSGALAAALELDGTTAGITRARQAAINAQKGWQFGTTPFPAPEVLFATSPAGPWDPNPSLPWGYAFVRVSSRVALPVYLLPVLTQAFASSVAATAVAGQMTTDTVSDNNGGTFPFSPFAIPTGLGLPNYPADPFNMKAAIQPDGTIGQGGLYNLHWPPGTMKPADATDPDQVCPDEQSTHMVALKNTAGREVRGYIWKEASDIREAILTDNVPEGRELVIGQQIDMTGGDKMTDIFAGVQGRVLQDRDSTSATYAQYWNASQGQANTGNHRRLVRLPINSGPCGVLEDGSVNTCQLPSHPGDTFQSYELIGYALFFLPPASVFTKGGNVAICAEYVGFAPTVAGSAPGFGAAGPGLFTLRLVE